MLGVKLNAYYISPPKKYPSQESHLIQCLLYQSFLPKNTRFPNALGNTHNFACVSYCLNVNNAISNLETPSNLIMVNVHLESLISNPEFHPYLSPNPSLFLVPLFNNTKNILPPAHKTRIHPQNNILGKDRVDFARNFELRRLPEIQHRPKRAERIYALNTYSTKCSVLTRR